MVSGRSAQPRSPRPSSRCRIRDACGRTRSESGIDPVSSRTPRLDRLLLLAKDTRALDAEVRLRDVQLAARHADPRTTTIYDRRREYFDRYAAYVVVAFVVGG